MKLRRVAGEADDARTFEPPTRLRVARALVELCRIVPVICTFGLGVLVLLALQAVLDAWGLGAAALARPGRRPAGRRRLACALATAAKWLLVGRLRAGDHPLWSSFIWRNELADTFLESVAVPWIGPGDHRLARAHRVAAHASARTSAAGSGARRTGCPRPTW